MGSMEAARRAGMVHADAAQRMKSAATTARTSGLEELDWTVFCVQ